MAKYVLNRILLFIPTLLIISLVVFYVSTLAPGSPIDKYCNSEEIDFENEVERSKACQSAAYKLDLDLPKFYFSLTQKAFPDSFYTILQKSHKDNLKSLILQYGNWDEIEDYYESRIRLQRSLLKLPKSENNDQIIAFKSLANQIIVESDNDEILNLFDKMQSILDTQGNLSLQIADEYQSVINDYGQVISNQSVQNLWIPKLVWYGINNQYHNWVSNFIKGDFGVSYFDGRKVSTRIKSAMKWTLIMNLVAIFFAYIFSIPIGVYSAVYKNSLFDRLMTIGLFLLHSLPVFWIGTMLIVFFTTSEYGSWTDIFPTGGLSSLSSDAPYWSRFWDTAYHLVLPIFCITYGAFAFITRQMRNGMLNVFGQQYMVTAKAKGLAQKEIIWKHGFKNGSFPLISMFATIFSAALAGSAVVEIIFSIPGMGRLAFDGILQQDWPVVNAILLLSAFLTIFGNLVADVLYKILDPRVKF